MLPKFKQLLSSIAESFNSSSEDVEMDSIERNPRSLDCKIPAPGSNSLPQNNQAEMANAEHWEMVKPVLNGSFNAKLDNAIAINCKSPEAKDFEEVVKSFIHTILSAMKEKNSLLDFRLIECGSYYEGLRVGAPYEFDYMLEILKFKAVDIISPNTKQILEHMEVKFVTDEARSCNMSPANLYAHAQVQFNEFKRVLIPAFRECVRRNENHRGLKVMEVSDHYNSPNFKLFLRYKGKGIMVDLVPCLRFPQSCSDMLPEYTSNSIDFIHSILPLNIPVARENVKKYITKQLYMVSTDLVTKWRISTSVLEFHIMKFLPNELKRALRVLKYLLNTHLINSEPYETKYLAKTNTLKLFGYKPFIPSYVLKLLFLHKVIEIHNDENGLFRNQNNLEKVMISTLMTYLKDFKQCSRLPLDRAKVEIHSFLFSDKHVHKFLFGKDLCLLAREGDPVKRQWYCIMLKRVEAIVNYDVIQFDPNYFKPLNYPALENVLLHRRSNVYCQ